MDEKNYETSAAPESPETEPTPAPRRSTSRPKREPNRPKRRWRQFLLIYAAVWLVLAGAGCAVFYKYLSVYERSRPEHVMDSLMETTARETWLGYVKTSIEESAGEFDDAAALYTEYETALLSGKEFSYRRASEGAADAPEFIVRCGGVDVCAVTLAAQPGSELGFGKHLWQVGSITPCEALRNLRSTAVEITALPDEPVYINGIELTDAQIAERDVAIEDLSEIEARFTDVPHLTRYRVEKMYGAITVTNAAGDEIAPEADAGDGVTRYVLPVPRYSVSISAPADVTVTLCGAVLTPGDAQNTDRGILRGLEEYTGDAAYDTVHWSFDGLCSVPDVQATAADSTVLSPLVGKSGQIMFFRPNDEALQSAVQDRVKYFFNRYIDYSSRAFQGNLSLSRKDVADETVEMSSAVRDSMRRYYGLLDCILWSTDLYQYVQNSTDAMIWASATSVTYDELTFTDFSYVGEDCFVCTIRYKADFTANAWQEQKNYNMQNAYELAFVLSNGTWYAAAMDAVTE